MTAFALLGFSLSKRFALLCLCAVPLELGAGSVDAALNNFVALHYKARHMSWLHCFWGIGASLGPVIMSFSLGQRQSWSHGYRVISLIQFALLAVLLATLHLWKKAASTKDGGEDAQRHAVPIGRLIRLPGAKQVLLAFFCYCAIETTVGLWGSSYLVAIRSISSETASSWISLYYLGITFGRFFSGFLAIKLKHKQMVELGQLLIGAGVAALMLPIPGRFPLIGLFLVGLGCAPIFPSLLHETPRSFGSGNSQPMMGLQMACAYIGTTFVPPLFGLLGANVSYGLLPAFIGLLLLIMIYMVRVLYRKAKVM